METGSVSAAGKYMQDSWIAVTESKEEPQRKEEEEEEKERVGEGEGGETEGNLTHSRSQQEMEQLLASAASDDEESEDNSPYVPTFTIPELPIDSGVEQVSRVIGTGERHASVVSEIVQSRTLGLGGLSWFFQGGVANFLFPVLILTHLALFGLGFYIGRRTSLVKTI